MGDTQSAKIPLVLAESPVAAQADWSRGVRADRAVGQGTVLHYYLGMGSGLKD